jgi:hypothetical protein
MKVHCFAAVLVVVHLCSGIFLAGSNRFEADRSLYGRATFEPEEAADYLVRTFAQTRSGPRGKVLALWGLADDPQQTGLSEEDGGIRIAKALAANGVILRAVTSHQADAQRLLGDSCTFFNDPLQAAAGANGIALITERQEFAAVSMNDLAKTLRGRMVLDGREFLDSIAADQAGLFYLSFAKPAGPPWLDGDFRAYVEHLKQIIGEKERILLVPVGPLATSSGRARWFLHLNYQLSPRRLYLWRPDLASGTSGQYRQWVMEYARAKPWQKQKRWDPHHRQFSGVQSTGSARSFNSQERAFVKEHQIDRVLFFTHNSDFRLTDWECVKVEDLR